MKGTIKLFLGAFFIIFIGLSLINMLGCVIYGFSDGTILSRIAELPYILFAAIALILGAVILLPAVRKRRK